MIPTLVRHPSSLVWALRAAALLATAMLAGAAHAQTTDGWPNKPVRLIAPFPPASTADVVGRVLGQKLSQRLGQQFIVDNRVGASGNIGADTIAKSTPDGYTVGVVTSSTHAVAVSLNSKLPYDPLKDFTPITMIANSPYALVLYPGVPASNIKELVALAKTKPGVLNYGSAGPASLAHLAGALFATLTNIQLTHVPYKSSAQSVVDLISGRLEMQFATIAPTLSNIRAGQLRALAVTGKTRVDALPDVPTMDEAGVPGYEATLWFALMGPAGMPAPIVARLNREAVDILNSAEMKETLAQQGFIPEGGTPAALHDQIRRDIAKWKEVIPKAGIKAE
jgi:tripartite-type tricarboxylate transporter receptor subunit TctC